MSLLQVRHLVRDFGGNRAVDDVSFDLAPGELLAMIGPNGAGKSTVFNMLGGQLQPTSGSVVFDGKTLRGLASHRIARLGVGRSFQVAATFGSMTVLDNVRVALLAARRRTRVFWRPASALYEADALVLLREVGMVEQAGRLCSELAYGDVKRLELAVSLAGEPRLLLMDEPTAGMGSAERYALMALVKRLVMERGMAVLFTEHSMDVVFEYAGRVLVLARGKVIAEGAPQAVRDDARVREVYFGTGATFEGRDAVAHTPAPPDALHTVRADPQQRQPLLTVRGMNAWYGDAHILRDVSLQARRGEVVALMGRNGAGKSTTFKALMGLLARRDGFAEFMGRGLEGLAPYEIARLGMGYVPEDRRIFTDLTVTENLLAGRRPARSWPVRYAGGDATSGGADAGDAMSSRTGSVLHARADADGALNWTVDAIFDAFPHLASLRNRPAGAMSGGEQQMLAVARALMGNPYLLLLDEPSEGVAPVVVEQLAAMILALKRRGASVLLSEQNIHFARLVADRAYVLERGVIRYEGAMDDLAADDAVHRKFLAI
ncbi:ATP-binding cassette domain-containing protein [Pusillimonas sp. TS35]|uniref:ATP-binding cassette domain-containing protein n=1 Tax=Paracandidimonas lactea TaxID=2895524 RepID=UPI00136821AC|nr:ATP-binding cassette domain-containing protein [Paracandidimonas lactea]MYN13286.1 ATP-binding cassette domain-containing protein [Pusillimonas sp. TS35]